MSRPYHLTIKRVRCHATDDYTGSDDLYGVVGPVRFRIGSFAPGDDHRLEIGQIVPSGEFHLRIMDEDLTGDDEIGLIDLAQNMDFDVTRNVQGGGASYDITYFVQSMPD